MGEDPVGAQDNAALAQALNDAYNARNIDAAVALCTPDVEVTNIATGQVYRGPDGIREFMSGFATAFPDSKVQTSTIVADDSHAVIEFVGRGTQTGPLVGPGGTVPPTGRSAETRFLEVFEMRDGKIARSRLYYDVMGMLAQLGVVPAPAQVQAGG